MPRVVEELAAILSEVDRPGDFYAAGRIELLAPRLEVEGVGPVALPLLPIQAEQLVAAAAQAPYGRGAKTLVDTSVRRTWQIGPDRVRIAGRRWARTIETIVARAAEGLGVSEPVAAELYKLLIYEEGGFFLGHRDTEKAPGMFATLVVALPSQSSGGELAVRHNGREIKLDLCCEEPSEVAFAAFYADCVHEVLPVASGYRATLVYNLVRQGKGARLKPPNYEGEAAAARELLLRWADSKTVAPEHAPSKLIYPLEHAYTSAELSFSALKGADAAVAGVLIAAAEQAACDLHLALIAIEESGAAEYVSHGDSRWAEPELEAGEVYDRREALGEWRRLDGEPSPLCELPVKKEEVCPPNALDDMIPDEEHFQEATGNEGVSFERSYRQAALVLWPSRGMLAVLNQAGLSVTLPYLEDLVARWTRGGAELDASLRGQALELAGYVLATWLAQTWYPYASARTEMARMLQILSRLQDTKGVDRLINALAAQRGHGKLANDAILGALALFSKDEAAKRLQAIVAANAAAAPGACAALLASAAQSRFASEPGKLIDAAATLVKALPADPARALKDPYVDPDGVSVDADLAADLIAMLDVVDRKLARRAASHMLACPRSYGLDNVLVPAARRVVKSGAAVDGEGLATMRAACLVHLKSRAAEPLEAPIDWRRDRRVGCRCEHCAALARFLADPKAQTWSFKAAGSIRGHVEEVIGKAQCDLDVRTDRHGRPYALICTKNRASYEQRVAQRKADLADIKALGGA